MTQTLAQGLDTSLFPATIANVTPCAQGIHHFSFALADTHFFTPQPGSHIQIAVMDAQGKPKLNHYSLVNAPGDSQHYHIAVQAEEAGAGGSLFMHRLKTGDTVYVSAQKNDFTLQESAAPIMLIAGGIGVTPIYAMAQALKAKGAAYQLHYSVRGRNKLAFADEMAALGADVYVSDEGKKLDVNALLSAAFADTHIYFCGPKGMIQAIIDTGERLGIPRTRLHFESFGASAQTSDKPVDVMLRQSGKTITVPVGISILDALLAEGVDCSFGCKRGECGACAVDVLEGSPDHRDVVLTKEEKAAGKMCICVSRALSPSITLNK
ncbi:MAG: PDR/VanB family oxidoreductase [Rickettsiales bacterium]